MSKETAQLLENKISSANPLGKTYRLYDSGGLLLLVTPTGGKLWRFKYRFEGKEKMLSFGVYPDVSIIDARSSRDAARELLTQGIDPSALRKEAKEREKAERMEAEETLSVRVTIDGKIEIWKGGKAMRLNSDEAQFILNLLNKIVG